MNDDADPLTYGFLLGMKKELQPESTRSKIVVAAWSVFREFGYEATSILDVICCVER